MMRAVGRIANPSVRADMKRLQVFVQRSLNLKSDANPEKFAAKAGRRPRHAQPKFFV
jgi:hypothetical protein